LEFIWLLVLEIWSLKKDGQKNPILLTLSNSSGLSDYLGHGMGSVFVEGDPFGPNGRLPKNGRRAGNGSHQFSHLELYQF
jgi:hypothetical protein